MSILRETSKASYRFLLLCDDGSGGVCGPRSRCSSDEDEEDRRLRFCSRLDRIFLDFEFLNMKDYRSLKFLKYILIKKKQLNLIIFVRSVKTNLYVSSIIFIVELSVSKEKEI